ncbi:MAG: UDP-N-acetylglucosamine 2-epimerase (non-hydrolyzing) [Deltaproteobacteria bacterium]|nr:UDP-N-acetylglucosamine 2-epimerase (non-hydrolyzing) [Deltaproteobacteria bacterium]
MHRHKLVTVIGARPQFIKASAVSRALATSRVFSEVIIHTGQHFDDNMSKVFFDELAIPAPRHNLGIGSLGHGAMTGRMLERIEQILLAERPSLVLVYGDTNSTLAGALAARKLQVPVAHVEAGLRSFNLRMPEEVNRILTDRISDLLFCPTSSAVANLRAEGFEGFPCRIHLTGDVMEDTARHFGRLAAGKATVVDRLSLRGRPFALCTLHRAENTDDAGRLASIVAALHEIARELPVVLPLHPRTAGAIRRQAIAIDLQVIEPVGYIDMVALLQAARLVLTDSGGLQKEAYFFERPCVTLRDETEWVELVQGGCNWLAGATTQGILAAYRSAAAARPDFSTKLYGGGAASSAIVAAIEDYFAADRQ